MALSENVNHLVHTAFLMAISPWESSIQTSSDAIQSALSFCVLKIAERAFYWATFVTCITEPYQSNLFCALGEKIRTVPVKPLASLASVDITTEYKMYAKIV